MKTLVISYLINMLCIHTLRNIWLNNSLRIVKSHHNTITYIIILRNTQCTRWRYLEAQSMPYSPIWHGFTVRSDERHDVTWCRIIGNSIVYFMMTSYNGNIFRVTGPLWGESTWRRGILRSPVESPHKCPWLGALMFYFICASINHWTNTGVAGDLRRRHAHYDVTVVYQPLHANIKENTKAPHYRLFGRETTGDRMIPLTKGQWYGIHFHVMTSSW